MSRDGGKGQEPGSWRIATPVTVIAKLSYDRGTSDFHEIKLFAFITLQLPGVRES
jgi:hypothetical protein